jgi:hypothetical protein
MYDIAATAIIDINTAIFSPIKIIYKYPLNPPLGREHLHANQLRAFGSIHDIGIFIYATYLDGVIATFSLKLFSYTKEKNTNLHLQTHA